MARIGRVVIKGLAHHVTQRGVRSQNIFFHDNDRKEYLKSLSGMADKSGVRYEGYCLMNNHVHLLVIPEKQEGLGKAIGEAHRMYTRMINFREVIEKSRWNYSAEEWKQLLAIDPDEIRYLRERVRTGKPCGNQKLMRKCETISGKDFSTKKRGPKF